jgi:vitamin B12 transporter
MRRHGWCLFAALSTLAAPVWAADDEEESEELEVVSVQAPIASGSDPTPAVYRLEENALARPGLRMADALAQVPGVQTRRTGGAADVATAAIRGSTSAQTPIYLGGVRLNDDLTGSVDLSTLPLWMLRRVSIYRGHAPIGADELGIGGAVQLEPRHARGLEARAALGVGSFGERLGRGAVSVGAERAGGTVAIRHRSSRSDFAFTDDAGTRFDASDDVERKRDNADHREIDAWAIGRARLGKGSLSLFLNAYDRSGGAPGLQLNGASRARQALRRVIGGASGVAACADGCSLAVDVGALLSRYRLSDPARELGTSTRVDQQGERLTERVRLSLRAADSLELGFGALLGQQRLRVSSDLGRIQSARRVRVRPEASALWHVTEPFTVAAVAALECQGTEARGTAGQTCGLLEPAARLGARYQPSGWLAFFANAGRYVRPPTLGELYGVGATALGNAELTPETGASFDAGANLEHDLGPARLWGQVVGFARLASDLIAYRRSSFGAVRPYNARSARVLGAELATGATLLRWLDLAASLTITDPRDTSDDRLVTANLLPFLSRLVASPSARLRSPRWSALWLDEASVGISYLHRSSRVADPAGLILLEAQHFVDLDAAFAFAETVTIRGRVANIGDQRSVDLVGYPLPGRSFHGLVEARW